MTVSIRAAVDVHYPEDIGPPCWSSNDLLPEGREMILSIRDLTVMFSESAARCLLAILSALMSPGWEPHGTYERVHQISRIARLADEAGGAIKVAVRVHNLSDVGRPRWQGRELVVSVGSVVVIFSEPAARRLEGVLAAILAPEQEVRSGVGRCEP